MSFQNSVGLVISLCFGQRISEKCFQRHNKPWICFVSLAVSGSIMSLPRGVKYKTFRGAKELAFSTLNPNLVGLPLAAILAISLWPWGSIQLRLLPESLLSKRDELLAWTRSRTT